MTRRDGQNLHLSTRTLDCESISPKRFYIDLPLTKLSYSGFRYAQSLSCLGDLILLEPTNTFYVLRHAETAYTIGDYALAYRGFLRAFEMAGPMVDGGLGRRAGLGAKLALKRMNALGGASTSGPSTTVVTTVKEKNSKKGKEVALLGNANGGIVESDVSPPKKAKDIDALITQELLVAYSRGEFGNCCHVQTRERADWGLAYSSGWMDPGDRVAGHAEAKTLKMWLARGAQAG